MGGDDVPAEQARELRHRRDGEGVDPRPRQDAPRPAAHAGGGRQPQHQLPARRRRQPDRRLGARQHRALHGLRPGRQRRGSFATSCRIGSACIETVAPSFGDVPVPRGDDAARRRPRCRVPPQLGQPDAACRLPHRRRHRAGRARRPHRAGAVDRRRLLSHRAEAAAPPAVPGHRLEHRAGRRPRRWRARRSSALPVHQLPSWYDVDDLDGAARADGRAVRGPPLPRLGQPADAGHLDAARAGRLLDSTDLAARLAVPMPASLVA